MYKQIKIFIGQRAHISDLENRVNDYLKNRCDMHNITIRTESFPNANIASHGEIIFIVEGEVEDRTPAYEYHDYVTGSEFSVPFNNDAVDFRKDKI